MLKKIYQELVAIRKELQAIRRSMEFNPNVKISCRSIGKAVRKSIHDTSPGDVGTS